MKRIKLRRPVAVLTALLTIVVGVSAGAWILLRDRAEAPQDPSLPATRPLLVPVEETVETVKPVLRITLTEAATDETVTKAASVDGVATAARLLLANLTVEVPGGDADVSIAAVEPKEFRPLAPESTAQTKFVWEGLYKFETLIAHEQYPVFGGRELRTLAARGPAGRKVLKIGGLASSGVPNLAGAMMSLGLAEELGLGAPRLLLIALDSGAGVDTVAQRLGASFPDAAVDRLQPPEPKRFLAGSSARQAIGSFTYTTNENGTIVQDPGWVRSHITSANMPLLGRVRCHRVLLPQLDGALKQIQDAGLTDLIKPDQYGGCHVPRFIDRDGTRPLSMHAWGLAFDINVADNPKGQTPKMDPRIVAIFERWGFRWGGRWSPPDGHHFELGAIIEGS
ncbi:MAG: M15 family metallopeptidase [Actinomycetota bacterium]